MNDEILKLARECDISTAIYSGKWEIQGGPHQTKALEAFYIKAFNAGLEAAANVARSYEPACDTCPSGVENAIRALEMKP